MSKEKPSYYAILTANVRYDKRLKANEKLLYAEITALSQSNGRCWASNGYFAEVFEVDKITISRWISSLASLNYIKSELTYKEGTRQIEKRFISIVSSEGSIPLDQKINTPIDEKINTPIDQIAKGNNTSIINNTSNNNNSDKKKLFSNSKYNDYEEVKSYLLKKQEYVEKYKGVDLRHYIDAVDKWSDRSGKETTDRGWIAYIREFMDRAIEEGKFIKLKQEETRKEKIQRLIKDGNISELAKMGVNVSLL